MVTQLTGKIARVYELEQVRNYTKNADYTIRKVILKMEDGGCVALTLWSDMAKEFSCQVGQALSAQVRYKVYAPEGKVYNNINVENYEVINK